MGTQTDDQLISLQVIPLSRLILSKYEDLQVGRNNQMHSRLFMLPLAFAPHILYIQDYSVYIGLHCEQL